MNSNNMLSKINREALKVKEKDGFVIYKIKDNEIKYIINDVAPCFGRLPSFINYSTNENAEIIGMHASSNNTTRNEVQEFLVDYLTNMCEIHGYINQVREYINQESSSDDDEEEEVEEEEKLTDDQKMHYQDNKLSSSGFLISSLLF